MKATPKNNSGYQVVGVTTPTQVVPDAEMLSRDDLDDGQWTIHSTPANAGDTKIDAGLRSMFVPTYDNEISRHIRAQQMFYAKVSPTSQQYKKLWAKREQASARALGACEQLRITTLMKEAGFEPENFLQKGSERYEGLMSASNNDFQGAVLGAVASAGTFGGQEFMGGVTVAKPEWAEPITKIVEQAQRFYASIIEQDKETEAEIAERVKQGHSYEYWTRHYNFLNSTGTKAQYNGFGFTEKLANWLENLIGAIEENKSTENPPPKSGREEKGKEGENKKQNKAIGKAGDALDPKKDGNRRIARTGAKQQWEELKVSKPMLTKSVMGAIGRKRVASPTGRNPRRMSRLLTDPERRIFDKTVRGAGGVVLVDTSGSMSLSREEVEQVVLHAPSALVAQYSGGRSSRPNLYVIADKGRMLTELPRPNGGNGCDYPALEWAIKQRQNKKAPVIWVSDGQVTGKGDSWSYELAMECIKLLKKESVYVVPTPEEAIELLKKIQRREKVASIIPYALSSAYLELTGHELVLR